MALIACPECGHSISSLARFCPKCNHGNYRAANKTPRLVAISSSVNNGQEQSDDNGTCSAELLLQREFKPSSDEMVALEGRILLIKSTFNILNCYAYLTSKRFTLCDDSGVKVVFQAGVEKIVYAEEGRHLLSKKIVVTTASGEIIHVKCQPHLTWLGALSDPKIFAEAAKKAKSLPANVHASRVDWFYEDNGINVGPVKEETIVRLIQNNHTIFPQTKVWNASLLEWKRAEDTILTIYFSESALLGVGQKHTAPSSRIPGLSLLKKALLLFRKYV